MHRNLRLILAYDGTGFHGWQAQHGVRTVQQDVQTVLQHLLRHPLVVTGASRTDAGVHARGQVANVHTSSDIPIVKLRRAIGSRLPADIALVDVADASLGFRAIRDARRKLYRYTIHNSARRPAGAHAAQHTWHIWHPLDVEPMQDAADRLVGTHDFTSFAGRGSPRESNTRTVHAVEVRRRFDSIFVDVVGGGFLYNQVRNMVGTLFEIGRGHWRPERIAEILAARDRNAAGPTAPPGGLCLEWVHYDPAAIRTPAPLACPADGSGSDPRDGSD
ncbi:MAG: tRNA pseudouridine(38-40) synthase TruA [Phycisphaerae bacterium]